MSDAVVGLLTECRDLLKVLVGLSLPPEETGCDHPADQRVSLATLDDPDHWVCRVCRFENKG